MDVKLEVEVGCGCEIRCHMKLDVKSDVDVKLDVKSDVKSEVEVGDGCEIGSGSWMWM